MKKTKNSYKKSGVNIETADKFTKYIAKYSKQAFRNKNRFIAHGIGGFGSVHNFYKLTDAELRFTIYLVCLRLSISVTMSNYRSRLFPKNTYLKVSEDRAWNFLKKMYKENLEEWGDKLLYYAKS